MAITLFGWASTPADTGSNSGNTSIAPAEVTPPTGMTSGQLVVVFSSHRGTNNTVTHQISNNGGQSWTSLDGPTTVTPIGVHWCIYDGTWDANPSFYSDGTVNQTYVMLVFNRTDSNYTFGFEGRTTAIGHAGGTITITGRTTTNTSTVSIAVWTSQDDNTWGTLSGTGWSKTGLSGQIRNLAGQDGSQTQAYNIQTSAVTLANVSQVQLTQNTDGGFAGIFTFYEILSSTPTPTPTVTNTPTPTITSTPTPTPTVTNTPTPTITSTPTPTPTVTNTPTPTPTVTNTPTPTPTVTNTPTPTPTVTNTPTPTPTITSTPTPTPTVTNTPTPTPTVTNTPTPTPTVTNTPTPTPTVTNTPTPTPTVTNTPTPTITSTPTPTPTVTNTPTPTPTITSGGFVFIRWISSNDDY